MWRKKTALPHTCRKKTPDLFISSHENQGRRRLFKCNPYQTTGSSRILWSFSMSRHTLPCVTSRRLKVFPQSFHPPVIGCTLDLFQQHSSLILSALCHCSWMISPLTESQTFLVWQRSCVFSFMSSLICLRTYSILLLFDANMEFEKPFYDSIIANFNKWWAYKCSDLGSF